jgi:hypothetical protein
MTPLPRIALYTPDGEPEFYENCVINDSLIPDLSFEGEPVGTGRRIRMVTNLAYKIIRDSDPREDLEGEQRRLYWESRQ